MPPRPSPSSRPTLPRPAPPSCPICRRRPSTPPISLDGRRSRSSTSTLREMARSGREAAEYKVRFDVDGTTFFPELGPEAPRNVPVSFTIGSAHIGDRPIDFDTAAQPTRDGSIVSFDRGGLVEWYDVRVNEIEQLFTLTSRDAAGDLKVVVDVETDLAREATGAGLRFVGSDGAVTYSNAIIEDATGRIHPATTTMVDDAIHITVSDDTLDRAAFPITIDPVIATFDADIDDEDDRLPDVAYDLSNDVFIAVWEDSFSDADGDTHSFTILRLVQSSLAAVPTSTSPPTTGGTRAWRTTGSPQTS